jgi:hypothetical protein
MKGVRSEKEGFVLDQSQSSTGENVRFGDPIGKTKHTHFSLYSQQ